jgi:hypothetical protein
MKFTLEIDLDNDAFRSSEHLMDHERDGSQIARALRGIASNLEAKRFVSEISRGDNVRDVNGNTCGHWQIV